MRYVSIDTETTGLNPEYCQVIEFAAVIDDFRRPASEQKTFHCYVRHHHLVGEPYALAMNKDIIEKLVDPLGPSLPHNAVAGRFGEWLEKNGFDSGNNRPVFAAKNFLFDWTFLSKLKGWDRIPKRHRTLDPGGLFLNPETDEVPPGLEECLRRSGIEKSVEHTALADAQDVTKCLRFFYTGDSQ